MRKLNQNLLIVINGFLQLIEGQKLFAQEFGLHMRRVFPALDEIIQTADFNTNIQAWLLEENNQNEKFWRDLFKVLIQHQFGLLRALDGVALQTLAELSAHSARNILPTFRHAKTMPIVQYKNNQQLRYQRIIQPGVVNNYFNNEKANEALV